MGRKKKYQIAVLDYETDPFLFGRVPKPFCVEFYTPDYTAAFWGDDCTEQLIEYVRGLEQQYIIYAHNGGKFDFHFMHDYLDNPALIIKTRIVEAALCHHKVRDSFAILPVPLRDYDKMEFDYSKMEKENRERFKDEILEYLHYDCVKLYELVLAFNDRFGPKMTIGGTAMREIEKLHPFIKNGSIHDEQFRPYYYGGRVECYKSGILSGPWQLIDVNSMYPAAMRNMRHPINGAWDMWETMPDSFDDPFFISFNGKNRNALPGRAEDGSLTFEETEGTFFACSHEVKVALEYDLIDIDSVNICYVSQDHISFTDFVNTFYADKVACKESGDKIGELFSKLLLNSGYGRFGINPNNFEDWHIHRDFGEDENLEERGYTKQVDYETIELWSKPADISENQYCDVAIAASITSAARSILLRGLQNAIDPIYCDTDSIICRSFSGDIDPYTLGAWDLERENDMCAIGGKKLYAMYNQEHLSRAKKLTHASKEIKLSSKGGTLNLAELLSICRGNTIKFENMAPTFSLKSAPRFVTRTFAKTVAKAA